ncbi:hypothetical protein GIB67_034919 [Kingdonia uniflora]|uniref:Uncharacterized protein n=1 Tax=Kingdonia uniflora TaxID=39325 RepID=A0A7J7NHK0_9MAGN|nr:hypothetical protein GIB67_034919 [Kingdonia uniflora]
METLDLETIHRRIEELSETFQSSNEAESHNELRDFILNLDSRIKQIDVEFGELGNDELDAYLERSREVFHSFQAESLKISEEVQLLQKTYTEDSILLERDLEGLKYSLEFTKSQALGQLETTLCDQSSTRSQGSLMTTHKDCNFEVLGLDHEIEISKATLGSLQHLHSLSKRINAIEWIQDAMTGLKIIEFGGNCIRLSLTTFIPTLEDLLGSQKVEYAKAPFALNHELLIEVMDETMELKNAELFPNDVFIGEIVDAAKLRQFSPSLSVSETRSSIEWLVRQVQQRFILCTLRRSLVKNANNSRHSYEYFDKDEIIAVHMVGGIDVFIKIPQCWPILDSALKLFSLKSSDNCSKEISLSFLCNVEELVNSLDIQIQKNLTKFVSAIEEILKQQMRSQILSNTIPQRSLRISTRFNVQMLHKS